MPRTANGPRYFASKQAWYGTFAGDRVLLAKGPKKQTASLAKDRYDAELAARKVEVEGDRNTVWAVVNAYLLDLTNRVKNDDSAAGHLRMQTFVLSAFNEALGRTKVRDLRPQHVVDWLAVMRQPRWSDTGLR
jgi:hypothetical protein